MIKIDQAAQQLAVSRNELDDLIAEGELVANEDQIDVSVARSLLQLKRLAKVEKSYSEALNLHREVLTEVARSIAHDKFSGAWFLSLLGKLGSVLTLLATVAAAVAAWFSWDTAVKSRDEAKTQFKSSQEHMIRSEIASSLEAIGTGQQLNISIALLEEKLRTAESMHNIYGVFKGNWEGVGGYKAEFCQSLSEELCPSGNTANPISYGELEEFAPFIAEFCFSTNKKDNKVCK